MGAESPCTLRRRGRATEGTALLETAEIRFRGEGVRLAIPFQEIASLKVAGGVLQLKTAEGPVSLELGPSAAKWADKILHPKPVFEKLGVKEGMKVSVLGTEESDLVRQARDRAATVTLGRASKGSDMIFLFIDAASKLGRLGALRDAIRPNGAIWVVWPKGRPALKEDHVRAAGIDAGLVDVKVVAFSATHSALKLVIPVARR